METPGSPSTTVPGRTKIPPELWEAHRSTIHQIYVNENKTLKELQRILKARYGFDAS
jgi:hypothetical protein